MGMFLIVKGQHPKYNAGCPVCGSRMKYVGPHGMMDEYRCVKCRLPILYGGKMGELRRRDAKVAEAATLGKNKFWQFEKKKIF